MTARLITRLAGRRVQMQLLRSGVGPLVWAGEVAGLGRQPATLAEWNARRMAVGPSTAAGLADVLTALDRQARSR